MFKSERKDQQNEKVSSKRVIVKDKTNVLKNSKYRTITTGKAVKEILTQGGLSAFYHLVVIVGDFGNTYIMSCIDQDHLAASGIITSTIKLVKVTSMSLLFSTSILTGILCKSGQKKEVGKILQQSCVIAVILSIPIIGVIVFAEPIFKLLGQTDAVSKISQNYFRAYAIGFPFNLMLVAENQLALGILQPYLPLVATMLHRGLTFGLGYLLAIGPGAMPRLEEFGLGLSSTIASIVTFTAVTVYFGLRSIGKKGQMRPYRLFTCECKKRLKLFGSMLKIGVPIAIQTGAEMLTYDILIIMSGNLGADELAAAEMAMQFIMLSFVPVKAIGQAAGILVGRYIAKKQFSSATRIGNVALVISEIIPIGALIIYYSAGQYLLKVFSSETNVLKLGKELMTIGIIGQLLDTLRNVSAGALRGHRDTLYSMCSGLSTVLLFSPILAYIWGFLLEGGAPSIFWGMNAGIAAGAISMLFRWICKSTEREGGMKVGANKTKIFSTGCPGFFKRCCKRSPSVTFEDVTEEEKQNERNSLIKQDSHTQSIDVSQPINRRNSSRSSFKSWLRKSCLGVCPCPIL